MWSKEKDREARAPGRTSKILVGLAHPHPGNKHFVPDLIAPENLFGRVRVQRIARRVVECSLCHNYRSGGEKHGLPQTIDHLPVMLKVGYGENILHRPVGVIGTSIKMLPAVVHLVSHIIKIVNGDT